MQAETSAITPAPKLENDFYDWYARHDAKVRQAASGSHELVFIGDSITHLFEGDPNLPGRGERVWAQHYAPRKTLNLGFGWDRTQNVLWRIDHGELAGQKPRLAVLLIGTNNLTGTNNAPTNTPTQIAAGIATIHQRITTLAPACHLLLLGLLPRSTPQDPIRQRIIETNVLLADYANTKQGGVTFLDMGSRFLDADNRIPKTLMDDGVHPTEAGYRIWTETIEPLIARHLPA